MALNKVLTNWKEANQNKLETYRTSKTIWKTSYSSLKHNRFGDMLSNGFNIQTDILHSSLYYFVNANKGYKF